MARLDNVTMQAEEDVDLRQMTDEEAVHYLPDSPVTRGYDDLLRAQGSGVLEAMTDVLTLLLVSGGQHTFIQLRHGGMGEMAVDQRTDEAIELFINSGIGLDTVRLGSEEMFRAEFGAFIQELDLDQWEGDLDYLNQELDRFIDRMDEAGYLEEMARGDEARDQEIWEQLRATVEIGLETSDDAEVFQKPREEMQTAIAVVREPMAVLDHEPSVMSSRTERVQAFVQAVQDVMQGRDMEEPTQEHGAER